ncbi:b(o/a)3-type cytochrome-c oxidase subunit 1 [Sutcliffiella halmapala]|uniref:b(o/a)3-type cytochrome-c oxidase subunit 1 n=1 Tax=Sutcliffiella halmapala TaxID=79882 RepID=UPI000995CAF9|nr:b(o/a)3-type cytochrome-c oxidase subunit 1 [Sutcliffiella halmapala]
MKQLAEVYNQQSIRPEVDPRDAKLSMAYIYIAFGALFLGTMAGVVQGLVRGGLIELPYSISYYQLLTAHGVLLALVLTTFFIFGFLHAGMSRTMGAMSSLERRLGWGGYAVLTVGTLLSFTMILLNDASVLYTFYAPLQASPFYYIGLTLFVVGTWLGGASLLTHYFRWKKQNRGKLTPLFGFMTVGTILLWFVASIGVAATVLLQFLPWSLGLVDNINILLSRTLFWYFGHPLVYFWLLPAYIAWYVCIPQIIGGKLFSDSLARLAFILFLLFSIPVGFHHQLMEAGISEFWKYLQVVLTFAVIVPSLLTAFSIFATFELTGRAKGATGAFGWVKKLPWKDARFFAPFMGMLFFIPAGTGGIINASNQLNAVVHNTLWVVGHFHITVGSTVILTFFGIAYWLIPVLRGRQYTARMNKLAMLQTILWTVGMFFMSGAMHLLGLLGAPRRTAYTTYQDHPTAIAWFEGIFASQITMALGGVILFVASMLMIYIVINLAFFAPKAHTAFPIGEIADDARATPRIFENWKLWIGIAIALILFAYTIPLIDMIQHAPPGSPPFRPW